MNNGALYQTENMPGTRIKTLVVDDSPFMLKILAQTLEAAGSFDVVGSSTDGRQALRYVSMLSPDLVLMDLHMPGLNGMQVTRQIKRGERPPLVIIASSEDSSFAKKNAEGAGADAFVLKDRNLRTNLLAALQSLFKESSIRGGTVSHKTMAASRVGNRTITQK